MNLLKIKPKYSLACLILLGALLPNCAKKEMQRDKLLVAASISPLADFVQQVGRDRVEVFTVIPPGANPHAFELTPGLMTKMAQADLLVMNGVALEFWLDKVTDNLSGKKVVFAAEGLEILAGDEDHHAEGNPHVWLNPQNAIYEVKRICSALVEVDAANKAFYEENAAAYIEQLETLDQDIQQTVASWQQKRFVCFHPAWEYFANRYGLEQAAVIEERPGTEPSPQHIAEIVETVKSIGAKAVFAEAQFPSRVAEMIAKDSGIGVVALDPIGGMQNTMTYVDLMRYNVAQMIKVMQE